MQEAVAEVASVEFNVCLLAYPPSVGLVRFVRDVDMSRRCAIARWRNFSDFGSTLGMSLDSKQKYFFIHSMYAKLSACVSGQPNKRPFERAAYNLIHER
jgi:hypothetical protein